MSECYGREPHLWSPPVTPDTGPYKGIRVKSCPRCGRVVRVQP